MALDVQKPYAKDGTNLALETAKEILGQSNGLLLQSERVHLHRHLKFIRAVRRLLPHSQQ